MKKFSQTLVTFTTKFSFSNVVEFNSKKVDIVDGKQMVYSVIAKDDSLCLYEIDVTDKQGWGKLQNPNNVYQVDAIERAEVASKFIKDNNYQIYTIYCGGKDIIVIEVE